MKLDIKLVAQHIKEAFKHMPANAQELTLFLGNTGAGKSTIIASLLQKALIKWDEDLHGERKDRMQNRIYLEHEDLSAPAIGEGKSCTQFLATYSIKNADGSIALCDTPGFFDTEQERRLANVLALEKAVMQATAIKIVMVVNYAEILTVARGDSFKSLAKELGELLRFTPQLADTSSATMGDILFLVNDVPARIKLKHVIKEVEQCRITGLEMGLAGVKAQMAELNALKQLTDVQKNKYVQFENDIAIFNGAIALCTLQDSKRIMT